MRFIEPDQHNHEGKAESHTCLMILLQLKIENNPRYSNWTNQDHFNDWTGLTALVLRPLLQPDK